jgi:hypothetical protein
MWPNLVSSGPSNENATGFQGDDSGRELLEEGYHLRAPNIDPQHWPVMLIYAV